MSAAAPCPHSGQLYARPGVSLVFFVEEIERRQADVGYFLLIETGDPKRRRILPEYIGCRSGSRRRQRRRRHLLRRRSAGRRCKRQPRDSEHGYSLAWTLPLRSTLHLRHSRVPPHFPSTKSVTNVLHPLALFCDHGMRFSISFTSVKDSPARDKGLGSLLARGRDTRYPGDHDRKSP